MNKKVGFIGCGNMGKAMIGGIIKSKLVSRNDIIVSTSSQESLDKVRKEFGVGSNLDNKEVARKADILILAVKPHLYKGILREIKEEIRKETIVVSIGAGISLAFLKENLKEASKFIKTMPNTPASVGEGMSAVSPGEDLNEEEIKEVVNIFESFGEVEIIDEKLMDAFTAIAGSAPAYIFILIEAMADAGVKEGLARNVAYKMAAQAVLGSAQMVLESSEHPASLKDKVCSPSGTTIESVISLEKSGFRASIMEAMEVCSEKSKFMGNNR